MAQIIAICSMVRKDLLQFLYNKSFVVTFIVTAMFPIILTDVITFQVREVKIAIVAHDQSELTNRLIKDIMFSSDFVLSAQCATYGEALSLVEDGTVDCIIEIPKDFERDLLRQALGTTEKHTQIQISLNAINTTKAIAAGESMAGTIAYSLNNYVRDQGVAMKRNESFITTQKLFNPSSDYKLLMLPVIFVAIGFVFNTAAMGMANELQFGTIDQINVSPMSRVSFMASKLITNYILSMTNILTAMALGWLCYGFIPRGNFLLILLCLTLYVLSCTGIALWACNLLKSASHMLLFSAAFGVISMNMCGYITPLECVAEWLQPVTYILPPRYVMIILRNVALKCSDIVDLTNNFIPLAIMTVAFFTGSLFSFRKSRD